MKAYQEWREANPTMRYASSANAVTGVWSVRVMIFALKPTDARPLRSRVLQAHSLHWPCFGSDQRDET